MKSIIPPHAHKVFDGIIFDVYQREQEQFDGSFKTFECAARNEVVKAIPIIGDQILISRDEQPWLPSLYDLFGGMVEEDENITEAVKRETEEESWYTFEEYQPFRYSPYGMKVDGGKHYYIARNCSGERPQHLDTWWERITVHKVSFDRFIEIIISDEFCKLDFSRYIAQNYIIPNKLDELKKILFG